MNDQGGDPENDPGRDPKSDLGDSEENRARDSKKEPRSFWRLAATMSSLGWSLVFPIVGGAFLGSYLDKITGEEFAWTVGLLFVGVAMSLYNLYHILYKETKD
jgi:ATP synthase protein I